MLVCALGDVLLDVIVRLDGPIAAETDAYGRTHAGAGGQAANVAAWSAALGGRGRVIGKRARDPAGRIVGEELARRGVEVLGPEGEAGTGTVVSIATPDGRRALLTDRGVASELAPHELLPSWIADCDWLHVPGYSLTREPLAATAVDAARLAPRVSVDASSTAAIAATGVDRFRRLVADLRPVVVFATEEEAVVVGPLDADTVVVKRGAKGVTVRSRRGGERAYAARPAAVVDGTGAGDALAAGFLLGGVELALDAASRCVSTVGGMPA